MSATKRGSNRDNTDHYPTPAWCFERLLDTRPAFLRSTEAPRYLEPCAGSGGLIRTYAKHGSADPFAIWDACEILPEAGKKLRREAGGVVKVGDFFQLQPEFFTGPYDLVLTNPPFVHAWEFLHRGLELAPVVCLLLRLNYFGSIARHKWISTHMPDTYILPNRPSFRKNAAGKWATDSIEYAWFAFGREERREGRIRLLGLSSKEERRIRPE